MCGPLAIPIAGLALSAVGAVSQHNAQKKAAARQQAASDEQYAADLAALALQKDELNRATDENISMRSREAMVERGRLQTVMAASGLGDNSGRLERQSRFNEGFDITTIHDNRGRQLRQMEAENKAAGAQASSRSASIRRPSTIGTSLSLAQSALDFTQRVPPGTFGGGDSARTPALLGDVWR